MFHYSSYSPSFAEVANANSRAVSAEHKADAADRGMQLMHARLDALALVCQAQWELLREQTDLTDELLREKMQEVDLRDGKPDGRLRATTIACGNCSRPVNSRRGMCIYCGDDMVTEQVFDR